MKNRSRLARLALASLLAASASLTVACDEETTAFDPTLVGSALERDQRPDVSADEVSAVVAGHNAFALDLYAAVVDDDGGGNIGLSPYSVAITMAMAYAGAAGETADEMAAVLGSGLAAERFHPAFGALDLGVTRRANTSGGRLNIANAVWLQRDQVFEQAFLDTLARCYGAGAHVVDFAAAPNEAVKIINHWVSGRTGGYIEELLAPGSIRGDTRLILTNAVFFKARWKEPFSRSETHPAPFAGLPTEVEMMSQEAWFAHGRGAGWEAVELPYLGGRVAMLLVLPDDLSALEGRLDPALLDEVVTGLHEQTLTVELPRFSYRDKTWLGGPLADLGMGRIFDDELADFSGMSAGGGLAPDNVAHEVYVEVDEEGTTAVAATSFGGIESTPPKIVFDRPFLYFIRDLETGLILFVGRVTNPNG